MQSAIELQATEIPQLSEVTHVLGCKNEKMHKSENFARPAGGLSSFPRASTTTRFFIVKNQEDRELES